MEHITIPNLSSDSFAFQTMYGVNINHTRTSLISGNAALKSDGGIKQENNRAKDIERVPYFEITETDTQLPKIKLERTICDSRSELRCMKASIRFRFRKGSCQGGGGGSIEAFVLKIFRWSCPFVSIDNNANLVSGIAEASPLFLVLPSRSSLVSVEIEKLLITVLRFRGPRQKRILYTTYRRKCRFHLTP